MNKCHTPIGWQNNTTPALNETNLNYMDGCIETIDDRVVAMDTAKLEAEDVENVIAGVTMDDATGIFTFTKYDGSTFTIDTKLEKIAVNFRYDTATQKLIITLDDGTTQEVDLSALIQETDFADSATIVWTVTNHVATASVKANSIGDAQMQTGYLTDAQNAKNGAELAATSANTSRLESEGWATGSREGVPITDPTSPYYHNNAKYYSDHAGGQSLSALNDVQISSVQDGQALVYDGDIHKWKNGEASVQFATLPVTNLTAVPGDGQVTLAWTNPEDVTVGGTKVAELELIKVYRDGTLVERALMSTFTDTGLVNGQTYVYTVVAETTKGVESAVATISATPVATGLSITLNGAKNDVISVYDEEDTLIDTVTFESGETSGTLVIPNEYIGTTLKFESSVAKGTTEATKTQNYVQRTEITEGMSVINVMPEWVGTWYGNAVRPLHLPTIQTTTIDTFDYRHSSSTISRTLNDNDITLKSHSVNDNYSNVISVGLENVIDMSEYSKAKVLIDHSVTSTAYCGCVFGLYSAYPTGTSVNRTKFVKDTQTADNILLTLDISDVNSGYLHLYCGTGGSSSSGTQDEKVVVKAIWLEKSTSVNLTVEGAKEDNITVKQNGTTVATCIFGSGQTSGTVTLDVPSDGSSVPFVFESSISSYSKTANVSKTTTTVKVMRDHSAYWFGNLCVDVSGGWGISGYTSDEATLTPSLATLSTNHIALNGASGKINMVGTNNIIDLTNFTSVKVDCDSLRGTSNYSNETYVTTSKTRLEASQIGKIRLDAHYERAVRSIDVTSASSAYIVTSATRASSYASDVYAIWLE